jgi:pyruvate ferredoxin oxidoreductase beta subunit
MSTVPEEIVPVEDWLRPQERFAHLLRPENAGVVEEIQRRVTAEWDDLRLRCEGGVPA